MLFKSFKLHILEAYYRSDGPTSVNPSGRRPISPTAANKLGVFTLTFKVENDEKSALPQHECAAETFPTYSVPVKSVWL
jgi:hypothetical protein